MCLPAPYLILVFLVISIPYVIIQKWYRPSSRALRRMELEQKAPRESLPFIPKTPSQEKMVI